MQTSSASQEAAPGGARRAVGLAASAGAIALAALLAGCAGDGTEAGAGRLPYRTKVTDAETTAAQPVLTPSMVYVEDFDLEVVPHPEQQGLLGGGGGGGPVRQVLGELRGESQDPAEKARTLVDRMSTEIVEDLEAKGIPARRLRAGDPMPSEGWLVRGVVTELDEGNRIRKAVVGFGAGKSQLTLYVNFSNLSEGAAQPFYSFEASNNSGDMPGGAAMKMNPYAMAAKFVMSRNADEREVDHTASTIAVQLQERIQGGGEAGAAQ